jgi:hypothetical protein
MKMRWVQVQLFLDCAKFIWSPHQIRTLKLIKHFAELDRLGQYFGVSENLFVLGKKFTQMLPKLRGSLNVLVKGLRDHYTLHFTGKGRNYLGQTRDPAYKYTGRLIINALPNLKLQTSNLRLQTSIRSSESCRSELADDRKAIGYTP